MYTFNRIRPLSSSCFFAINGMLRVSLLLLQEAEQDLHIQMAMNQEKEVSILKCYTVYILTYHIVYFTAYHLMTVY